jgi:predicted membrane chloride channel (bestrophin family)
MTGVTEEAGSTARTLISSLASTPMVLALVVFNLLYIGFTSWLSLKQGERFTENQKIWEQMVEKAMNVCIETKKS